MAADVRGSVYSVWHAAGEESGDDRRRVYLAHSTDGGLNFAREVPISPAALGKIKELNGSGLLGKKTVPWVQGGFPNRRPNLGVE